MISPTVQQNFQSVNQMSMTQGYASNAIPIRGGREGAKVYPVAAGYAAFLFDEENQTIFLKINDSSGIPRPLREFKYEEVTPTDPNAFDPSKFATKEDFNILLNEIKKLGGKEERSRRHSYNSRRNNDGQSYEKPV